MKTLLQEKLDMLEKGQTLIISYKGTCDYKHDNCECCNNYDFLVPLGKKGEYICIECFGEHGDRDKIMGILEDILQLKNTNLITVTNDN